MLNTEQQGEPPCVKHQVSATLIQILQALFLIFSINRHLSIPLCRGGRWKSGKLSDFLSLKQEEDLLVASRSLWVPRPPLFLRTPPRCRPRCFHPGSFSQVPLLCISWFTHFLILPRRTDLISRRCFLTASYYKNSPKHQLTQWIHPMNCPKMFH